MQPFTLLLWLSLMPDCTAPITLLLIADVTTACQWLRQRGAQWPAVLQYNEDKWEEPLVQWARTEGCASAVL
jgi:hypothetical protein